jgi:hypothetical protein
LVGKIQLLQELLGDLVAETSVLLERTPDKLSEMLAELQQRLRSRGD